MRICEWLFFHNHTVFITLTREFYLRRHDEQMWQCAHWLHQYASLMLSVDNLIKLAYFNHNWHTFFHLKVRKIIILSAWWIEKNQINHALCKGSCLLSSNGVFKNTYRDVRLAVDTKSTNFYAHETWFIKQHTMILI